MNKNHKKLPNGLKVRQLAIKRLKKVLLGAPFIPFNSKEIADGRDRALANRLITISLRRYGQTNYIISNHLKKGIPKRSGELETILRIGISELLFMPSQAAHSAIYLGVEASKNDKKMRHFSKLINGVLRNVQREADRYKSLPNRLLFPNWLYKKWQKIYGASAIEKFAMALLDGAPLDLVLRDEKGSEPLVATLAGTRIFDDIIRIYQRDRPIDKLAGYEEGHWWVQDVSAALPAKLMTLRAGSSVLDMCCAPGGKLAQLIKQQYRVTGLDVDKERLKRVAENLSRLNYSAKLELADAREYRPKKLFDGILLDAPCSATGTFRRHPEIIWHRNTNDIENRVALQKELIINAISCLRPNGLLLYTTCSLEPEEGEEQVKWISKNFDDLIEFPFQQRELKHFANYINNEGFLRIIPSIELANKIKGAMDGFFIARFRKSDKI